MIALSSVIGTTIKGWNHILDLIKRFLLASNPGTEFEANLLHEPTLCSSYCRFELGI